MEKTIESDCHIPHFAGINIPRHVPWHADHRYFYGIQRLSGAQSRSDIFVIYSGGSHLHGNPAHVQKLQYSGK